MTSAVKTICDCVLQAPQRGSDKTAIMTKVNRRWKEVSWQEYYDKIVSAGCALLSLGLKPQSKVAIMSNTRFEWSIADYGILGCQAVTIPVYQTVTTEDLRHILSNSEAEILFVETRAMLKQFLQVRDQCPQIRKVICIDPVRDSDIEFMTWDEFMNLGSQEKSKFSGEFQKRCQATTRQDIATILYTSGTTGLPKGVVLTHEQIMSEITETFPQLGMTEDDCTLSFLPYAHVMGRIEHWGHLVIGFKMAYAESIERIRGDLIDIKPTVIVAVPRIFEKVYSAIHAQLGNNVLKTKLFQRALKIGQEFGQLKIDRKPIPWRLLLEHQVAQKVVLHKVKEAFGGRLRFAVSGGAPIAKDVALFFNACGVIILEGYGLTETTAAICVNTPYNYHFGSVGRPIGDVQIKIAEDGEILVKSKKVMREYYKNPEATEKSFTNGWFHTGDIGELLPSGDLKITDRKKDLIKTAGGKYVAPQHLENLLKMHSFISNVLIHGDQKKYIVALLTLDPILLKKFAEEKGISFQDIGSLTQNSAVLEMVRKAVAETNNRLASFETVKRFTILPHEFTVEGGELTPSLKVKRKFLDQKYKRQIDALYS